MTIEEASNSIALDLFECTSAHCLYYILSLYIDFVKKVENANLKTVLERLVAMFACSNFLDDKWAHIFPND